MGAAVSMIDWLLRSLQAAHDAMDAMGLDAGDLVPEALDDCDGALAALHVLLDLRKRPDLSGYLDSACDQCRSAIVEARLGRSDSLPPAIALLRTVRSAMQSALDSAWPEETETALERAAIVSSVVRDLCAWQFFG